MLNRYTLILLAQIRLQQDQRRKSSGGAHTAPAPVTPQHNLANRSGDSTNNFWQSNSRTFVPPSPTMTPKTTNGRSLALAGSSVNPLFNQAAEPSSQHDRYRPALADSGTTEQSTALTGRGATHSPSRALASNSNSQRQSVFGQLASPSLGHIQHAGKTGGADRSRCTSNMPEVSTTRTLFLQRCTR